jgi:hypothetical protein
MQLRSGKVINNNIIVNKNNYNQEPNGDSVGIDFIEKMINEIAKSPNHLSSLEYKDKIIEFIRLWAELYYYISIYFDNLDIDTSQKQVIYNLGIEFNKFINKLDININWSDFEYNYIYDTRADVLDVIKKLN